MAAVAAVGGGVGFIRVRSGNAVFLAISPSPS